MNDLSFAHELKNEILINYLNDLSYTQNLKSKQNDIDIIANVEIDKIKERELLKLSTISKKKKKKKKVLDQYL